MADSAAPSVDKTKEKKKKKASGSTKEKEPRKKSAGEADIPTDATPQPEPPKADEKVEAPQETGEAQPVKTASSGSKKTKKPKEQTKSEDDTTAPKDGSRKASVTEGASRKASVAGASRKASTVDAVPNQGDEDGEGNAEAAAPQPNIPEDDDIQIPVQPRYVVPPPITKKDINLLQDLDESKLQELKEAFELFDYNQDGYIDAKDLKLTYQSLGQLDVPDDDIVNMISEAINPLDFDAFVILLGYKTIELDPESILVEALSCWDYDNSGMISEERIKHDLQKWGDKFSEDEAEMALEDAPVYVTKKGVPMLDYLKFCNTVCGLRKKPKVDMPSDLLP